MSSKWAIFQNYHKRSRTGSLTDSSQKRMNHTRFFSEMDESYHRFIRKIPFIHPIDSFDSFDRFLRFDIWIRINIWIGRSCNELQSNLIMINHYVAFYHKIPNKNFMSIVKMKYMYVYGSYPNPPISSLHDEKEFWLGCCPVVRSITIYSITFAE
jgi:hypothetical protein